MDAITQTAAMSVMSTAFNHRGDIPKIYTCDGPGQSPPLVITKIPHGTRSLALIVEDPDAPGKTFDHWLMWNIPPMDTIEAGASPGVQGKNGRGMSGYTGPCPPRGTHRYFFKVYALDTMIDLAAGSDKNAMMSAMGNHILGYGELVGLYKREFNGL